MDRQPSQQKANNPEEREDDHPSPADFDVYLPWACSQLQVEAAVVITKILQQEYVSVSGVSDKNKGKKGKPKPSSRADLGSDQENGIGKDAFSASLSSEDNVINILAVYDSNENLVQLKFDKNRLIPRIVLKIIGLIIPYQINLNTITINKGMDQYSLYEICKFLPVSHITDLILDNTFIKEANYYHILESPNFIRYLSLARCSITDEIVKTMSDLLAYPQPSSKTLSILNLSTNKITDVGAKYFAESLRSNRQLSYLNLADNMLTDCGAEEILNTLQKFPLTFNELLSSRSRSMAYLKEKNELMLRIAQDLRAGDNDRRSIKRKSVKPVPNSGKKSKALEKEPSLKSMPESKSITNVDFAFLEKSAYIAENTMGEFKDPFSKPNTLVDNGVVYSHGNNALSYLNLSFNNLSYVSLKKFEEVLMYQKKVERRPRGLVNISIEGNFIPIHCKELETIDRILDLNFSLHQRRMSVYKKKPGAKVGGK